MGIDVYALTEGRSSIVANRFLDHFARSFLPSAAEYEFPRYADNPVEVFSTAEGLMRRLYDEPGQPYGLYWKNPNRTAMVASAMLFFTEDGGLIAGLTLRSEDERVIRSHLIELVSVVGAKYGVTLFESPPPDSIEDFKQLVEETCAPRISPEV